MTIVTLTRGEVGAVRAAIGLNCTMAIVTLTRVRWAPSVSIGLQLHDGDRDAHQGEVGAGRVHRTQLHDGDRDAHQGEVGAGRVHRTQLHDGDRDAHQGELGAVRVGIGLNCTMAIVDAHQVRWAPAVAIGLQLHDEDRDAHQGEIGAGRSHRTSTARWRS